ncbi:MAG TPA: hypothetical protein VK483_10855 [Chitinophagaceae bacterium]|nr:hypothetical protein [Chitinophagaceae bacterium]
MANNKMQFVAIVGGIWELNDSDNAEARKTAQEIGEALADAGMGLVVYFSDPGSLEPHVVTGYVRKLLPGTGAGSILVRFAEPQKNTVRFAEQATHPDVFKPKIIGKDWEAPFYRSLVSAEDVDAVLLMGGSKSTLIAGLIALERPLPVLAIDKFDGSAGIIRTELSVISPDYPSSGSHSIKQSVTWLKNKCEERAKEQEETRQMKRNYKKMISQKKKIIWASFAFIALLVTLFFGVARTPPAENYSFVIFSGLIAAGATGALIRSISWGPEETSPIKSLFLGAVAGFVVGLAYLIPQWIGAPGVLKPLAKVVETDKIQLVSAILVALSAGVGFDTVFNRLKKQAEELPISNLGK